VYTHSASLSHANIMRQTITDRPRRDAHRAHRISDNRPARCTRLRNLFQQRLRGGVALAQLLRIRLGLVELAQLEERLRTTQVGLALRLRRVASLGDGEREVRVRHGRLRLSELEQCRSCHDAHQSEQRVLAGSIEASEMQQDVTAARLPQATRALRWRMRWRAVRGRGRGLAYRG
jgi:hypothetical protein